MLLNRVILTVIFGVLIALISLAISYLIPSPSHGCDQTSNVVNAMFEIDSRVLITEDSSIVYASNESMAYKLYRYKNGKANLIQPATHDVFNPFLFKDSICGLRDENGNQKFLPTSPTLSQAFGNKSIDKIWSFKNGNFLIIHLKHTSELYLYDAALNKKYFLSKRERVDGCVLYAKKNLIVISTDAKLFTVDIFTGIILEVMGPFFGRKLNPYVYEDELYFISNWNSDFFRIYKLSLNIFNAVPELVYSTSNDLRMPKLNGRFLFFIEIRQSQYLLKRLDVISNDLMTITHTGVVFSYEIIGPNIYFVYADAMTPKSLMVYNSREHAVTKLIGAQVEISVSHKLINPTDGRSSAYLLVPEASTKVKGIILFFHADFHSDFSPRWENILFNLCIDGYYVLAPNYPMSTGYGKNFYNKTLEDAVQDMLKWKKSISKEFENIKLYLLSASAGNAIMEFVLLVDPAEVSAAASLFGIPSGKPVPITVPVLFVLGETDPYVNFQFRLQFIKDAARYSPFKIYHFSDEGHGLRNPRNMERLVQKLLCYFGDKL